MVKGLKSGSNKKDHIFSWTRYHLISFLNGVTKYGFKEGKLEAPSPTFIEASELMVKPSMTKEAILSGMIIDDKLGLLLVDKEISKKFKGIIGDVISQILKSIFLGKPISLSVKLFEPKSTLQRITDYWSFAPQFYTKANNCQSALERMKWVMTNLAAGLYVPTKQLKPFNPNIAETFQGTFEEGSQVYVEQISHYPTICRFYINDPNFKFYGYYDFTTKTESLGSKMKIFQKGPMTVEFAKKEYGKITFHLPVVNLLNAKAEENRSSIWTDTVVFVDPVNKLKGVLKFAENAKKIHAFDGTIYEFEYPDDYRFDIDKEQKWANNSKIKNKVLSTATGSWLENIKFDNVEYWNINTNIPSFIRPVAQVLPSDGRFREDLIWLYRSFNAATEEERLLYQGYSQTWKVLIEYVQRIEREIKKKNKK